MSVQVRRNYHMYLLTSTEELPTTCPEGCEAHIVDTGEELVYHEGMWVPDLRRIHALNYLNNTTP